MPTAQDTAERHILGILLVEPGRWHGVLKDVDVADFADPLKRKLAELYWSHQRDEGEPVFSEFLSQLAEADLAEVAIELVEEVESLPSVDDALKGALLHFQEERRRREERKLVAQLRRTEDQLGEQDEVSLLKKLQERVRKPDMLRFSS